MLKINLTYLIIENLYFASILKQLRISLRYENVFVIIVCIQSCNIKLCIKNSKKTKKTRLIKNYSM